MRTLFPGLLLAVSLASTLDAQRGAPAEGRVQRLADPEAFRRPDVLPGARGTRPPAFRSGALPAIVVTGYWPPSNEAARRFSDDPTQNPLGWIGGDWEGRGYDVFAYFPEFTPPDCSSCGQGTGDLEVDYQDTTADFRPLVDQHDPVAVVTLSRGFFNTSWEVEMNQYNRTSWINDYTSPFDPTPAPPDASVPPQTLRLSSLPVQDIVDAVNAAAVGMPAYICFSGDGGGFLSEFVAYQGVWYQSDHRSPAYSDWCVAAGHVHIGGQVTWPQAEAALGITLREVIAHVDAVVANTVCQPEVVGGGPGTATLNVCGDVLASEGSADLVVEGAPADTFAVVVAGTSIATPVLWKGGLVQPVPPVLVQAVPIDAEGRGLLEGLPGGGGPVTIYTQVVYRDPAQAEKWGFTPTLAVDVLP